MEVAKLLGADKQPEDRGDNILVAAETAVLSTSGEIFPEFASSQIPPVAGTCTTAM